MVEYYAMLIIGFKAGSIFSDFKMRVGPIENRAVTTSITEMAEQRPMLSMIAMTIRDVLSTEEDDEDDDDHYADWLERQSNQ